MFTWTHIWCGVVIKIQRECYVFIPWWRHQMKTFSALLALCAGNSPVTGEFPAQRPVTRSFDVFFDLRLNKRLSKQSWGWWYETPLRPLWRHSNVMCLRPAVSIQCLEIMSNLSNSWCSLGLVFGVGWLSRYNVSVMFPPQWGNQISSTQVSDSHISPPGALQSRRASLQWT